MFNIFGVDECTHGIGLLTYIEALQNKYQYQEYQQTGSFLFFKDLLKILKKIVSHIN